MSCIPLGTLSTREMSIWNLWTDFLNVIIAEGVNFPDFAGDIPKIGTIRETATQLPKMGDHFLSFADMICSRSSELINCKPDLVHTCNESSMLAVAGHKVGGCSF